jgi:8-oxo-dGTP pyrophosphatase MutT (NUDIX family)/GNAT superfamily N-acetyltransferase
LTQPFSIRPITIAEKDWVDHLMITEWGAEIVIAHGDIFHPAELPGFIAAIGRKIVGLITYNITKEECEIITINSQHEGLGIGTALIDAVLQTAQATSCQRLFLVTTNNNLHALRFYQKRGFILSDVRINAIARSRELKPQIPLRDEEGLPIRDEIELEMPLNQPNVGCKTNILFGEHIGKRGKLRFGCSAVLFDEEHNKVLLTRRTDNGMWCLPGGMINAGESVSEACEREVWEETGLHVRVCRLTGVYSDPDYVVIYPDGNRAHIIVLNFEVEYLSGEPGLSNETTGVDWFPVNDAVKMDLFHNHASHIQDALEGRPEAFIR